MLMENILILTCNEKYVKAAYENPAEPEAVRHFFASFERDHPEDQWAVKEICVYNHKKERYEDVGSIYSASLLLEIKRQIFEQIEGPQVRPQII